MAKEKKHIQFGDNTFAVFMDEKPLDKNKLGEEIKPICMIPSERLVREADISKEELNSEDSPYGRKPKGTVWREYPSYWVQWIRNDWLFIWCSFNKEETEFTKKMGNLGGEIDSLNRQIDYYSDGIIKRDRTIHGMISQIKEYERDRRELEQIREGKEKKDEEEEKEEETK